MKKAARIDEAVSPDMDVFAGRTLRTVYGRCFILVMTYFVRLVTQVKGTAYRSVYRN